MRLLSLILIALLPLPSLAFEDNFLNAQTAYDSGRYAEATLLYENMVSNGISNTEVYYNLANACFKDGDLPTAIQYYRIAWYNAPRDPDIRANLHFALNAAGAIDPAPGFIDRALFSLSVSEWIMVAIGSYLVLMLLLMLALFMKSTRRSILKLCLIPMAATLLAGAGWRQWYQLKSNPEWIVVKTEATALFGPIDNSTAHYKLPLGALVRQTGTDPKGWIEVEYDGKTGWLRRAYLERVSP
ncbi:MAG: hypothetical protein OES84_01975 [Kiritimatiellaceae bacterium]|nr:hypothetical protein [Kiritimatiellaceae bacterium]